MNKMDRKQIYLAAPLFSAAEKEYNLILTRALEVDYVVFLPQRDGEIFTDLVKLGSPISEVAVRILRRDIEAIKSSVAVVAVLDGRAIDEGVAFELGFAFAICTPCFGLQTDSRRLLPEGNNPMILGSINSISEDVDELKKILDEFLKTKEY